MISKSDYSKYVSAVTTNELFSPFDDSQLEQITNTILIKDYRKGQLLFDQGDQRNYYYFVISGIIKSFHWDESGEERLFLYIKEGNGFPYSGLFKDEEYAFCAETLTPTIIAMIPMDVFETTISKNVDVMKRIISRMGDIIDTSEVQLQKMVTTSAKCRIQSAINFIGNQIGEVKENHTILIPYQITLIELSKISGTTRETTSQIVHQLIEEHKISYNRKYLTILNGLVAS